MSRTGTETGKRVSIHDIAGAAAVSITTVSHALNGKGRVLPATRERVLAVADELGYRANPHAQRLATGRHMTLAMQISGYGPKTLVPDSAFFVELLNAASGAAIDHGYALVLAPPDLTSRSIEQLAVDGAIVVDPTGEEALLRFLSAGGAPVVTVGRALRGAPDLAWVDNDHRRATARVLDHFADMGYERPALLTGGMRRSYAHDSVEAYRAWVAERGLEPIVARVRGIPTFAAGFQAAASLLDGPARPDAIHATLDALALGALRAAHAAGLRVPEDLGIAAAVDSDALRSTAPPLTAVQLHARRIGREAVRLLTDMLGGEAPEERSVTVPARLVSRDSTRR